MRTFLIAAAAMSLGGAAIAQNTPTTGTTGTAGGMQTQPGTTVDPATNAPTDSTMSQPMNDMSSQPMSQQQPMTDPSMQPAPQQPMADPSMQPMSQGQTGNMSTGNMQGMAMSSPPTGEYPRCSRTVTDRCTQVARSSRPRRR